MTTKPPAAAAHEPFLRAAIAAAARARAAGNHPFGAVLALDGRIVLEAENAVVTMADVTRHAELELVSRASRALDAASLARATLYASTEPCPMCAGAIYWSGIRAVVYGCSQATLAGVASGSFAVPCRDVLGRGREPTVVTGPLLEQEAAQVHLGFWRPR